MAGFVLWMNQHLQQYSGAKVGRSSLYVCDLQQNQNVWCVASTKVVLLTGRALRLLHEAVELISSRWDRPPTGAQLTESVSNQGCTRWWERRQEHFYLFIICVFYSWDLWSAHQLLNSRRCLVLLPGGRMLQNKTAAVAAAANSDKTTEIEPRNKAVGQNAKRVWPTSAARSRG